MRFPCLIIGCLCKFRSNQSTLRSTFRTTVRTAKQEANGSAHTATNQSPFFSTVEATYLPAILATGWPTNRSALYAAHGIANLATVD